MTTPKSIGMSGEVEWWEKEPYAEECYGHAGSTGYETHYDIPAILKEQRRLVLEEVRAKLPPFLDVEPAGDEPPADPMLAADQVRNFTLNQVHKILASLSPKESE